MAASEIFIDTSGFYALLVRKDDRHEAAAKILSTAAASRRRFVTSDYVLDETANLLKARGRGVRGNSQTVVGSRRMAAKNLNPIVFGSQDRDNNNSSSHCLHLQMRVGYNGHTFALSELLE